MSKKNLLDSLVSKGVIALDDLASVKAEAKKQGLSAEEILYQRGVSEDAVLEVKSEILGVPAKRLMGTKVPYELLREIPEESARFYQFVPIGSSEEELLVGMVHPDVFSARAAVELCVSRLRPPFKVFLNAPSDFQAVLQEYKSISGEV